MDDATINALGVFVLVAVGILVAGFVMGRLEAAIALSFFVGATFATASYLLFREE